MRTMTGVTGRNVQTRQIKSTQVHCLKLSLKVVSIAFLVVWQGGSPRADCVDTPLGKIKSSFTIKSQTSGLSAMASLHISSADQQLIEWNLSTQNQNPQSGHGSLPQATLQQLAADLQNLISYDQSIVLAALTTLSWPGLGSVPAANQFLSITASLGLLGNLILNVSNTSGSETTTAQMLVNPPGDLSNEIQVDIDLPGPDGTPGMIHSFTIGLGGATLSQKRDDIGFFEDSEPEEQGQLWLCCLRKRKRHHPTRGQDAVSSPGGGDRDFLLNSYKAGNSMELMIYDSLLLFNSPCPAFDYSHPP